MAILSIQSHVSFGYVGNSAARFALQYLGHEVWPIHTVLFSNHLGHGSFKGDIVHTDTVRAVLKGLLDLGVGEKCDAVLSGYLGQADTGIVVKDVINDIRRVNSDAVYVCDPVIGDTAEGTYVAPELVKVFRDDLIPLATVITPNAYELSELTGDPVGTINDALKAARKLMKPGPSITIVTSVIDPDQPDQLNTLLITPDHAWTVPSPLLVNPPKGAGDLLSALWLARYLEGKPPEQALVEAVSSVFSLIQRAGPEGGQEFPLIGSRQLLQSPDCRLHIKPLD